MTCVRQCEILRFLRLNLAVRTVAQGGTDERTGAAAAGAGRRAGRRYRLAGAGGLPGGRPRGEPGRAELVRLQLGLRRRLDDPEWPAWEERLRALWADGVEGCQPTLKGPFGIDFVLIPPGEFWMGARDDEPWRNGDESPRHRV